MSDIHSTAVVAPEAEIGEGCSVGPYSVIGPKVKLGNGCRVAAHVVIEGNTTIGDENQIFQFASVGAAPQDLKYHGEDSTLEIGSRNIIREYVTLQPGTEGGGMQTTIGDQNLFMACCHVGHDCRVGHRNVFANSAALAGHVTIGDGVIVGGLSGVHQFVTVGDLAFLAAGAMANRDVPPFCMAQGDRAGLVGLNVTGLKRNGFDNKTVQQLRKLYREVFATEGKLSERVEKLAASSGDSDAANKFLSFIKNAARGVTFPRNKSAASD